MGTAWGLLLSLMCLSALRVSFGTTNSQDAAGLQALMNQMKNVPPDWGKSGDPCGEPGWDGVTCENSRVTKLKLYNMGLEGTLSSDIGSLAELQVLDLSYNIKLGGPLTSAIGKLKQLNTLILIACSFSGNIPNEIGDLAQLTFLALNSNQFTGEIPASIGSLSKLFWFDLADNQLSGTLPVSTNKTPGLDQLFNAKHFHLNKNQFSGPIPEKLFNSNLSLLHVLLDRNQLTGSIPASVGLVQSLKILRLDDNSLSGPVPSNINNLTSLGVLNLANNDLTGPMPNLTGMNLLNSVDLSNNSFDPSETPAWFSEIDTLSSLVIQSGRIHGEVPQKLFSFPGLQKVILSDNKFNGSLEMGSNISRQLHFMDFQNNALDTVEISSSFNDTIILAGNPVCSNAYFSQTSYCISQQETLTESYSSSEGNNCTSQSCPQYYNCSHPYTGRMIFRAPFFQVLSNSLVFELLKVNVWRLLNRTVGSISLQNPFFDDDSYLQVELKLCPLSGDYFNRSQILIELDLSTQNLLTPVIFGPYYYNADQYHLPGGGSRLHTAAIIGLAVGCSLLVFGLLGLGLYALRQKKRAESAIELIDPFASWGLGEEDNGSAPQIKKARWFSYDELKKYTNNFPQINEVGSGGYGKVYRGMLPDGQIVAIKRSEVGSNQGGVEFKAEIELLSRVHHKNLLELVGFCFQQGERMLVYEFIPNGTLRESLSGESGIQLDWKRRLKIALGSATGLAYLHEHANPPIIHRDVKSTNILLDGSLNAKVADFGLSLVSDSETGYVSTQVKGTLGYLDPEYYMTQQLTEKSDVYSFGVVMLELVTASLPIHKNKYIVREVKMAIDKHDEDYYGLTEIMDPVIRNEGNLVGFRKFVELALRCVEDSSADRPTMNAIAKEIEMILHHDGPDTNSTSDSSSANEVLAAANARRHAYNGRMSAKDLNGSSFDYSGSLVFSTKLDSGSSM